MNADGTETMERLTSTRSKTFEWSKSGKLSTLATDGKVYARVTWAKSWGSLATGESADGEWTLKRVGFMRPRVTVRKVGSQSDLVVVSMDWTGGGTVSFSDASSFNFKRVGFWRPELVLTDPIGNRIFSMTQSSGFGKQRATLKLESEAARSSWRTTLLAIVGWYLAILISEYDNAAVVAAVSAH